DMDKRIETTLNLKVTQQTQDIKKLALEQMQADMDKRVETAVNVKISDRTPDINTSVIKQIQGEMDKRIDAVVTLKIADQTEGIKNLVVQQIEANIDKRIQMFVEQSTGKNVEVVANNVMGDIDNRINVNFDHKILSFREDVNSLVKNEINENYTESLKSIILADLKNQQFYFDMQSIKVEVENFYARLGQFETQLNRRITQGDTQVYNWTLEQLVALQGCLTDRQALVELFESFSAKVKTALDGAPCVQPSRFTAWVTTETNPEIEPMQPAQLPEGEQSH
ncbi:MAG: hypothetical protein ACRDEA_09580, partial [Microcystaceae cyanobacterium]